MKYCCLGVLGKNTSGSSLNSANREKNTRKLYNREVKIKKYAGPNTPIGPHTDHGSVGLGQYNNLGEYCGPHTASSVFLILLLRV